MWNFYAHYFLAMLRNCIFPKTIFLRNLSKAESNFAMGCFCRKLDRLPERHQWQTATLGVIDRVQACVVRQYGAPLKLATWSKRDQLEGSFWSRDDRATSQMAYFWSRDHSASYQAVSSDHVITARQVRAPFSHVFEVQPVWRYLLVTWSQRDQSDGFFYTWSFRSFFVTSHVIYSTHSTAFVVAAF